MAVIVGIDEAGFGPVLGPLVVSASAFSVPDGLGVEDLPALLRRSVASHRRSIGGKLLVTDSKKAFSRSLGIRHLARTVLACLRCLDSAPMTVRQLLAALCPDCLARLDGYPWYGQLDSRGLTTDQKDIQIASSVLARDMAAAGVSIRHITSRCVDVEFYNAMVGHTRNKAAVLYSVVSGLINAAVRDHAAGRLEIFVDRLGGRSRYGPALLRSFPSMHLSIIREDKDHSIYQLASGSAITRLHFVVAADQAYLPVSLASMASKYVRELLMGEINRYFGNMVKNLRPTAGYWQDGNRFVADLKAALSDTEIAAGKLIRCR